MEIISVEDIVLLGKYFFYKTTLDIRNIGTIVSSQNL